MMMMMSSWRKNGVVDDINDITKIAKQSRRIMMP